MDKLQKLKKILKEAGSVLVAYSGGVDSSLLLRVAFDVLGDNVLAATAASDTYPKEELEYAIKTAKNIGVQHKIIKTKEFSDKRFIANSAKRCYFCKKELFGELNKIAAQKRLNLVIEASTLTDNKDFRPGSQAKKELKVRSPLVEAGFTKEDVRRTSRALGLSCWNKPSCACLASRIPYGTKITKPLLKRIENAEAILRKMGFRQVRLRSYNGLCRIEVDKNLFSRVINKSQLIITKLKDLGYKYITVDLEGYRTGSMNLGINKK